jgi:DNA polymerase-3 subunit epsilon
MYLFFDTETTGVPKNYNGEIKDLDNWPRIIQLAFCVYDKEGNFIDSYCQLIKPNGWIMPTEEFWQKHGYTHEKSLAEGLPIEEALLQFTVAISQSSLMVAHNLSFDFPIVAAEMLRAKIRSENKPEKFCTMKASTDICKIPGARGYKWPKLEELHQFLFNEGFDGAHDALNDVKATAKCFFEMKRRGVFEPKAVAPSINVPSVNDL